MSIKGIATAVGLTFLTACSTTPQETTPLSAPAEKSESALFGEKNPVTGCYESKKKGPDGSEVITDIVCPFVK